MNFRVNHAFWGTTYTGLIHWDGWDVFGYFSCQMLAYCTDNYDWACDFTHGSSCKGQCFLVVFDRCYWWAADFMTWRVDSTWTFSTALWLYYYCMYAGWELLWDGYCCGLNSIQPMHVSVFCIKPIWKPEHAAAVSYLFLSSAYACYCHLLPGWLNGLIQLPCQFFGLNKPHFLPCGLKQLFCGLLGHIQLLCLLNGPNNIHKQPFGLNLLFCGLIRLILLLSWLNVLNNIHNQHFGLNQLIYGLIELLLFHIQLNGYYGIILMICGLIGLILLLWWLNRLNNFHIQFFGLKPLFHGLIGVKMFRIQLNGFLDWFLVAPGHNSMVPGCIAVGKQLNEGCLLWNAYFNRYMGWFSVGVVYCCGTTSVWPKSVYVICTKANWNPISVDAVCWKRGLSPTAVFCVSCMELYSKGAGSGLHVTIGLIRLLGWLFGLFKFHLHPYGLIQLPCWLKGLIQLPRWLNGTFKQLCWFFGLKKLQLHPLGLNQLSCGLIGLIQLPCWLNGLNNIHNQPVGLNLLICGLIGLILLLWWLNGLNNFHNKHFGLIQRVCGLIGLILLVCWLNGLDKSHIQPLGLNKLIFGPIGLNLLYIQLNGGYEAYPNPIKLFPGCPAAIRVLIEALNLFGCFGYMLVKDLAEWLLFILWLNGCNSTCISCLLLTGFTDYRQKQTVTLNHCKSHCLLPLIARRFTWKLFQWNISSALWMFSVCIHTGWSLQGPVCYYRSKKGAVPIQTVRDGCWKTTQGAVCWYWFWLSEAAAATAAECGCLLYGLNSIGLMGSVGLMGLTLPLLTRRHTWERLQGFLVVGCMVYCCPCLQICSNTDLNMQQLNHTMELLLQILIQFAVWCCSLLFAGCYICMVAVCYMETGWKLFDTADAWQMNGTGAVWYLYGTPANSGSWKTHLETVTAVSGWLLWGLQIKTNRNSHGLLCTELINICYVMYVIQDNIADRFRMIVTLRIGYLVSYFWSPKPVSGDDRGVCPPYVV